MRDKHFYDLCYEAYLTNRNPDNVSVDKYDHLQSRGYRPEEIYLEDIYPREKILLEEEFNFEDRQDGEIT